MTVIGYLLKSEAFTFLLYRLSSVFVVQTSYVPDEYWQSLEVAHKMVFNYGYLTWEWKHGLRSYIYPSIFAAMYKLLHLMKLDSPFTLVTIPRIFQALLTALSDYYFFHLCRAFGCKPYWIKFFILTNWFLYFCGSRTIVNMFETSLTIIALYYYPWNIFKLGYSDKRFATTHWNYVQSLSQKYIPVVVLNCIIRPTAVTIWAPFVLYQLVFLYPSKVKGFILLTVMPISIFLLLVSILIDYIWYERLIFPPYNFFMTNILSDVASFYGTHSGYWYITQGTPTILGLHTLPFILGFISALRNVVKKFNHKSEVASGILMAVIVMNVILFSMIPHKEFRFILPLLPMMEIIAIKYVSNSSWVNSRKGYRYSCAIALVISFVVPSGLFGVFHQRGTLSVMRYLSDEGSENPGNASFLFLMPCHSAPGYSHLHVNVSVRFLTCDPPLSAGDRDESDEFFNDPPRWLETHWNSLGYVTHVVSFDSLAGSIEPFITEKGFRHEETFIHTILRGTSAGDSVLVYRR